MGEAKSKLKDVAVAAKKPLKKPVGSDAPMTVATPGGCMQVRWDTRSNATVMGQLAFFAEFLEAVGLFDNWVEHCPLHYSSPNAPKVRDVLGTWLLSILDGQRRYAHVAGLRGDSVAPKILGMSRVIGDESLRRALAQIAPAPKGTDIESEQLQQQEQLRKAGKWMKQSLRESVQHALDTPWILDIDSTVKLLYGHQNGAEIGYNPKKPGRPSHTIHTYWLANLRLVLDAEVQSGKSSSSAHSLPALIALINGLSQEQRPQLVRGDCGFGNERVMCELEAISQNYLFKLKQSANVKRMIERQWRQRAWSDAGQGWEACEDTLALTGWSMSRRVIVMRRAIRGDLVAEMPKMKSAGAKTRDGKTKAQEQVQICLQFADENEPLKLWEYAVLVTNTTRRIEHMGQLYRDRADCENGFDELKNQWGWGGYSTQDIERCNLSAQAVALIYNWWSWYVRLANPGARMEAVTSRPMLLAAVGRVTEHGGQTRVLLSITHAAAAKVKALVNNIRDGLQKVLATAPQLTSAQRWRVLALYIIDQIIAASAQNRPKSTPPIALEAG